MRLGLKKKSHQMMEPMECADHRDCNGYTNWDFPQNLNGNNTLGV